MIRPLLALCLVLTLVAPSLAQPHAGLFRTENGTSSRSVIYQTGFEEFTPGNITGQHGWLGINQGFSVTVVNPHQGTQHFRGISSGLAWSFARSPFVTPGPGSHSIARAMVNIGATGQAAPWEFTPGVANQGGITTVRFNPDRTIDVRATGSQEWWPTGFSAPTGWFEIAVEVENATGFFRAFLNGAQIAARQGFLANGIESVIIYSTMPAGTAGHTFDMDDFAIIDGIIPVELTGFEAVTLEDRVALVWETGSEKNKNKL
jgi:hypothetical protein